MMSFGRHGLSYLVLATVLTMSSVGISLAEPLASSGNSRTPSSAARKRSSVDIHSKHPPKTNREDQDSRQTLKLALQNYRTMLKVIANNIANAETPGYKSSHVLLVDDELEDEAEPGEPNASGLRSPAGLFVGTGSRISGTHIDFRQGRLRHTDRPLDLAIVGDGFFQVKDASGAIYYCRAGCFCLDASGQVVLEATDSCRILEPAIVVTNDASRITLGADGQISWRIPGSNSLQHGGTIQLAKFANPQGLRRIGESLYTETDGCGTAQVGAPGDNSFGKLRQGCLEESNVDVDEEIAEWKRVRKVCRELQKLLNEK